ncbi:MAG: cob(I)yrinic acid a,c-diamide adenosyltransferase [Gammaproteobacteria bacterium]|nr:cob(I)yrinic acid a,c-diamide adenosyltransferase [Gammaproteobacteria bacterium]
MGHRLSKIYTKTGDDGTTGLSNGSRVPKDDPRVEAMGAVDELNSAIGLLMTETLPDSVLTCLHEVQHNLFDLGGELSMPGHCLVKEEHVTALEQTLDQLNASLAPLKEFILPGGTRAASLCHIARATCRRAERRVHTLAKTAAVANPVKHYLNRLSDLLFVMARVINKASGEQDTLWKHDRSKSIR